MSGSTAGGAPRRRLRAYTKLESILLRVALRVFSPFNVLVFRLSGGRILGGIPGGAKFLLLTTRGRKSGQPRTAPLLYLEDGERAVVVASQGGLARHPAWYLNLEADPEVEVETRGGRRSMRARTAAPDERAALWQRLTAIYSSFDDYQARTQREIPVVILEPR